MAEWGSRMFSDTVGRVVDDELDELISALPAVAIEGARAVGKTHTALQRGATIRRLDDPAERNVVLADPTRALQGERPVVIDEWQRVPEVWDLVRRAVDHDRTPGQFILTGSADPMGAVIHSGAGRIVSLRMRPLALAERGLGDVTVSLATLLSGNRSEVSGRTSVTLEEYVREILQSGFPGMRHLTGRVLRRQLDGYVQRIFQRDFPEMGRELRSPDAAVRWFRSYAAAIATSASYETIRDAATSDRGDKPSRATTQPYTAVMERLWVLEPVDAWLPERNAIRRLASPPKHNLVDPALAARVLAVSAEQLLQGSPSRPPIPRDGTFLGALFESLVTQSVRVYAQASEAEVRHFRTHGGEREVDLIVVAPGGGVVAVEVKLARTITDEHVRQLRWLRERVGDEMLDAVVISTGPEAYRRRDGIAVVPAALLGP